MAASLSGQAATVLTLRVQCFQEPASLLQSQSLIESQKDVCLDKLKITYALLVDQYDCVVQQFYVLDPNAPPVTNSFADS